MSKHNFNRNFAVVIGINNYTNGIRELETAVPDAYKLAQILQKQYQALKQQYQAQNRYEVQLILNQRATRNQLNQLILDFKNGQIPLDNEKVTVTEDDRVFFYFAGHGIALEALENQEGPVGYLIPQDATKDVSSTYLPMQELHDALNALSCRHMLAILDCCFAGAFRWASLKREIVPKVTVYKERYDRFISDRAWQVITSAADDQKALDSWGPRGEVRDGNEVHSPFAKALFDALRGGADEGADSNKDGIITATELYSYLRDQVEILTENHYKRQTPGLCPLKKHDKGEFIFLLPYFERDKLKDAPPLNLDNNPYLGLQSYDEKHSHLFFGRENLIQKLYQKAVDNKQALTLVLGASGTGKSSLMKAGLLPRLCDSQEYQFKILDPMRPGESPLKALAQVCSPSDSTITTAELAAELAKDEQALANIIERWSQNYPNTKLLLPVDQFEELITLCKSDQEREQFQKLIKNALAEYPDKIHVVITLRLDFEGQFQTSVLKDFWNDDTRFVVPPMTQDEFREAIEKPALEKVVYFDPPSLVDELINEVVQMPGALPLLSFTLSELYLKYLEQRRDNRALKKEDYEELGRVVGSLTKRANQEYDLLVPKDSAYADTVRWVMLRMISLQGGELARRQVPKLELVYPDKDKSDRVQIVIERFSEARLIVEGSNSQGEPYVEPAHDALIRGWDKLLAWKQDQKDQENLILQRQLTAIALDWKNQQPEKFYWNTTPGVWVEQLGKRNQQLGLLWNANPRLDLLKQVLNSQTDNWLNQLEAEFVISSLQRRRNNQLRAYGLGALVLAGVLLFAFNQWNQNQQTQSINLATSSRQRFGLDQQLDALVDGLKAGKTLQRAVDVPPETTVPVVTALQQVVYNVKEHNRLQGHNTAVGGVSFCNDGKTIASVSQDGIIKRWDLDGKELDTIDGQTDDVESVSFSRDCKMVALGSRDATITLWNLDSKKSKKLIFLKGTVTVWGLGSKKSKKLVPLKGHITSVTSVGFSPNGKLLASGTEDGTVTFWSINGDQLWTIQGHSNELDSENNNIGTVQSISFSPDGKTIASASWDGTIKLWSLDGKEIKAFQGDKYLFNSVSFSPDGKMLASGNRNGSMTLWNLNGNSQWTRSVNDGGQTYAVWSVSFSFDGNTLASASRDGTIKIWSLDGTELDSINGHSGSANSVSFSLDGKTLAAGNEDGSIKLWSLSKEPVTIVKLDNLINCFSFSPDGKTIALGSFKKVTIWSLDGKQLKTFDVAPNAPSTESSGQVESLSFSPDGKSLAASANFIIQLWSLENGKELWKRPESGENYSSSFSSVSFSPDGKIATPDMGEIKLLSLDGKELNTLKGYSGKNDISFSPDGKTLAVPKNDNTIQRWRITDGKELPSLGNPARSIQGGKTQATSISFSPKDKILASGSDDGIIKLWNLENGKVIRSLNGHTDDINSVSFSPDGKILASGSDDSTIRLWSLNNARELDKIEGYKHSRAYFSPDGKTLAVVSGGTVTLLNIDLNDLLRRGCDRVRDYLHNNPNVRESDRHLCDDIPPSTPSPQATTANSSAPSIVQPLAQNALSPTPSPNNGQDTPSSSAPANAPARPQNVPSPTPPSNNGQNNYRQAPSDRNQASKLNSTSVDAYINQGLAYHKQRNYQQAISSYSRAITLNPNSVIAYSYRALADIGQKDYLKAIADSSKAITLNPTYANAYIYRGVAYYYQGNSQQAIADYTKAIELAPNNAIAYNYRALAYTHLGKQQAAQADKRKAAELSQ